MCASRSGLSLFFLQQGLASSLEFGLANTVFLFPGSRISSHRISPAEQRSPCVDEVSPQANGQEASIGERPLFLRRRVSVDVSVSYRQLQSFPVDVIPSQTEDFAYS